MKCKDCKYCDFVEYDGYMCSKVSAFINEELINQDIDCMIYDCDTYYHFITIDEDGCKNVAVELPRTVLFTEFNKNGCIINR